jgi:hypothetical protein
MPGVDTFRFVERVRKRHFTYRKEHMVQGFDPGRITEQVVVPQSFSCCASRVEQIPSRDR